MNIAQRIATAVSLFLTVVPLFFADLAQTPAQTSPKSPPEVSRVTGAAVWNPSADVLAAVRATCGAGDPLHIENCFLDQMRSAAASPESVAFSKSLTSTGVIYLRAFRKVAHVDVAYIQYVFRANELDGVLLVNGDPSPIDVDDETQYPQGELQKFPPYAELADKFPNISIWPGDRNNTQLPKLDAAGWGTQTFLVDYILRDGCHACAQIGTATLAFSFDTQGKFQGARVASVKPAPRELQSSAAPDFGTAGVEQIRVLAGKEFSITLPANHTTGYSWRLATTLDSATLKLISNTYTERDAANNTVGAPGEEVWNFVSTGQGTVPLLFEYARPFEKDAKPAKTSKFLVLIE